MRTIKYMLGTALVVLCMVRPAVSELFQTRSFDEINPSGMQVGDKLFSNFSIVSYTSGVLAVVPSASRIQVSGVYIDGRYGIRFSAPWIAGSEAVVNSMISFKVSVLPESGMYIAGNLFALTASNVGSEGGRISAVETVWDAEPGSLGANRLSSLGLLDAANSGNQKLTGYREFYIDGSPVSVKEIWVTKDITLLGGREGESGVTHLSEFTQTFSQVPEPASAGMLSSGIILAMLRRSRKNKQGGSIVKVDEYSTIDSMILAGAGGAQYAGSPGTSYAYAGRKDQKRLPKF